MVPVGEGEFRDTYGEAPQAVPSRAFIGDRAKIFPCDLH